MTRNDHMERLNAAFDALFNHRPITDEDHREHQRLVSRQRARDEAARRAPQQEALQLP